MATVLRIEDPRGMGPFCCISVMNACNAAMGVDDHHADLPTAYEEIGIECHWRCGVADARTLVRWFPRAMRRVLALHGYRLHVLDVPDSALRRATTSGQILFDPEAARKVATRALAAPSRAA